MKNTAWSRLFIATIDFAFSRKKFSILVRIVVVVILVLAMVIRAIKGEQNSEMDT